MDTQVVLPTLPKLVVILPVPPSTLCGIILLDWWLYAFQILYYNVNFLLAVHTPCTGGLGSFALGKRPYGFPNGQHIILDCESTPSVLITSFRQFLE